MATASRIVWKGAIRFGPVHLRASRHTAKAERGNKSHIVKGVAIEDGHCVVPSDEQIAAASPRSTRYLTGVLRQRFIANGGPRNRVGKTFIGETDADPGDEGAGFHTDEAFGMILFDHIEPPPIPDVPNRPPPAPPPDVIPVRDPQRPEHPDPVREPPGDKPPVAASSRRGGLCSHTGAGERTAEEPLAHEQRAARAGSRR